MLARRRAQKEAAGEEVRAARDRAEALLSEVNHRVVNRLALVASFVNLQQNAVSDRVAKDALEGDTGTNPCSARSAGLMTTSILATYLIKWWPTIKSSLCLPF
jgi:Histidine kinase